MRHSRQWRFRAEGWRELKVESTICHEIRQSHDFVVIDDVDESLPYLPYRDHHTPAIYGLKSYISVPIIRGDGSFFGTLCAIDAAPHKVDNSVTIGMFRLFAKPIVSNLDKQCRSRGDRKKPIEIGATTTGGRLELWVANSGQPISDKVKTTPFRPFFRGEVRSSQQGFGSWSLHSERDRQSARGKLSVNSDESETRFTLTMPL